MQLLNYFRSSSSYRVRIACNLKKISYEYFPVHLNRNGGEQFSDRFVAINPQQLVPLLDESGTRIAQSLAIMEYLDERFPDRPIMPCDPAARAQVRQIALYIACEMHPLNNLRVLKFLTAEFHMDDEQKQRWASHWLEIGLAVLETQLREAPTRGEFCFGDTPTLADCCLVPQLFNARRFGVDLTPYPTLCGIDQACGEMDAFRSAHPSIQPDAE